MKINQLVVKIISERIMNKGLNPKTNQTYMIEGISNVEYRAAVENYIKRNSNDVKHNFG